MARPSLLFLSLILLVVVLHGCLATEQKQLATETISNQGQQQNECQLDQLTAMEPSHTEDCEAGRVEHWDHNSRELRCAGVHVVRYTIEPNGLFLPTFFNAPKISYVIRGHGVTGRVMAGCPETFMDSEGSQQGERGQGGRRFRDMHQKVDHVRQGDVLATPSGVAQWCYNNGNQPLVLVAVLDISNSENQLDRNPRSFNLAGNNQHGQQSQRGQHRGRRGGQSQQQNNIFNGFDPQILAEAFNMDVRTAQELQNQDDNRGNIVRVQDELQIVSPPLRRWQREEEYESEGSRRRWYRPGRDNGLEETFCTMRFHENLDDPSRADVYKPQLGRISTLNSMNLPILRWLRLSAMRGVMRSNALMLPHWNVNANELMYVTRGEARIQVVNDNGRTVFDQEVREGQLLTIPQGFAVAKHCERGCNFEWISFKTNDNAMINTLAGRTSVMRALPVEVIANAYQISNEEARRIKFNTFATMLTHASSRSSQREWERRDEA